MPNGTQRRYFVPRGSERGRHDSFRQKIQGEWAFRVYQGPTDPQSRLDAYNAATRELQDLVAHAAHEGISLRARGSSWSLSKVAVTDGQLIDTKALRLGFDLPPHHVPGGDATKLRFIECGA